MDGRHLVIASGGYHGGRRGHGGGLFLFALLYGDGNHECLAEVLVVLEAPALGVVGGQFRQRVAADAHPDTVGILGCLLFSDGVRFHGRSNFPMPISDLTSNQLLSKIQLQRALLRWHTWELQLIYWQHKTLIT